MQPCSASSPNRRREGKNKQESQRVMLVCQSALVQSCRSHLKPGALPVFARLPHGSECTGTCITNERMQGWGLAWGAGAGGRVAFECECCWGFDPRADQQRCSQRGHGRNQGTTSQNDIVLQYSICERAGARSSPRFTCLHEEGERGVRLMRHLCRHVRIIIEIVGLARLSRPGLSLALCAVNGRTRLGSMHQNKTKTR